MIKILLLLSCISLVAINVYSYFDYKEKLEITKKNYDVVIQILKKEIKGINDKKHEDAKRGLVMSKEERKRLVDKLFKKK